MDNSQTTKYAAELLNKATEAEIEAKRLMDKAWRFRQMASEALGGTASCPIQ